MARVAPVRVARNVRTLSTSHIIHTQQVCRTPTHVTKTTFGSFLEANKEKLTIVDIHHRQCEPCKQFLPLFNEWTQKYYKCAFAEIEYDFENRSFLRENGVMMVPTIQVYKGTKVFELVGINVRGLGHITEMMKGEHDA